VDILHHAMTGAVGAMALGQAGEPLAGAAFLVASVAPDMDSLVALRSNFAYLSAHQGISHGIGAAAILAAIAFLGCGAGGLGIDAVPVAIAAFAGVAIHAGLDLANTRGVAILSPFSKKRLRLDAAFFVDPISWCVLILAAGAVILAKSPWPALVGLAAQAAQLAVRALVAENVRRRTGFERALPDPIRPWKWHLTRAEDDGSTTIATADAFGMIGESKVIPAASPTASAALEASASRRGLGAFPIRLAIVEEAPTLGGGTLIVARDVAMRPFGSRYGEISIELDAKGRKIHESCRI
jgi:membrane-bound metal-dependent hydrolase YbcI (DUF457 family)